MALLGLLLLLVIRGGVGVDAASRVRVLALVLSRILVGRGGRFLGGRLLGGCFLSVFGRVGVGVDERGQTELGARVVPDGTLRLNRGANGVVHGHHRDEVPIGDGLRGFPREGVGRACDENVVRTVRFGRRRRGWLLELANLAVSLLRLRRGFRSGRRFFALLERLGDECLVRRRRLRLRLRLRLRRLLRRAASLVSLEEVRPESLARGAGGQEQLRAGRTLRDTLGVRENLLVDEVLFVEIDAVHLDVHGVFVDEPNLALHRRRRFFRGAVLGVVRGNVAAVLALSRVASGGDDGSELENSARLTPNAERSPRPSRRHVRHLRVVLDANDVRLLEPLRRRVRRRENHLDVFALVRAQDAARGDDPERLGGFLRLVRSLDPRRGFHHAPLARNAFPVV